MKGKPSFNYIRIGRCDRPKRDVAGLSALIGAVAFLWACVLMLVFMWVKVSGLLIAAIVFAFVAAFCFAVEVAHANE